MEPEDDGQAARRHHGREDLEQEEDKTVSGIKSKRSCQSNGLAYFSLPVHDDFSYEIR